MFVIEDLRATSFIKLQDKEHYLDIPAYNHRYMPYNYYYFDCDADFDKSTIVCQVHETPKETYAVVESSSEDSADDTLTFYHDIYRGDHPYSKTFLCEDSGISIPG